MRSTHGLAFNLHPKMVTRERDRQRKNKTKERQKGERDVKRKNVKRQRESLTTGNKRSYRGKEGVSE